MYQFSYKTLLKPGIILYTALNYFGVQGQQPTILPAKKKTSFQAKEKEVLEELYQDASWFNKTLNGFLPSSHIEVDFTWSRAPRYGLDRNNNGIIDIPNSWEYVQNQEHRSDACPCVQNDCQNREPQFKVYLDVSGTFFQSDRKPRIRSGRLAKIRNRNGSTIEMAEGIQGMAYDSRELYAKYLSADINYIWEVNGQEMELQKNETGWRFEVCLPEGEHTIKLIAKNNTTREWNQVKKKVLVEDFLIVTLGDSYASGEGNPERALSNYDYISNDVILNCTINSVLGETKIEEIPFSYPSLTFGYSSNEYKTLWADDGKLEWGRAGEFIKSMPGYDEISTQLSRTYEKYKHCSVHARGLPKENSFSPMAKEHDLAHRSSVAATSQLAFELENHSDKFSVTYVNLAMSGATISKGVLGPYKGLKQSRFYGEPMTSQVDQLKAMVGNRKIDALYLNVGGNDIGFANTLEALIIREGLLGARPSQKQIGIAVRTGDWHEIENRNKVLGSFTSWTDLIGLDNLTYGYQDLQNKLLAYNFNIAHIYLTGPPDLTSRMREGELQWCPEILGNVATIMTRDLEIDQGELEWAYNHVLIPLDRKMKNSARTLGWIYIEQAPYFANHGLCADPPYHPRDYKGFNFNRTGMSFGKRFFRAAKESSKIQGGGFQSTTGTAHPNELGHQMTKVLLRNSLRLPNNPMFNEFN